MIAVASVVVLAIIIHFFVKETPKEAFRLDTTTLSTNKIMTTVTATGTVDPITEITVGTQVSGIISKIYVDYNSIVKKGQILAELDKTNLQNTYNSQLQNLNNSKTQYEFQQKNFLRSKELHDQNLISDIDYETAKYNFDLAETSYKLNQSNLKQAQTNLNYATIKSPINGVVLSRAVQEGQTVAASFSTPTLFDIAQDLTKMQVIADVDEADIGGVKDGQRVSFSVDAFPNDTFSGTVTQVRLKSTVTSNVVTYQVVVNTPNKDLKLKPGLTATITIYTVEKNDVATLPNKALNFKPDIETLQKSGYTIENNPKISKNMNENERIVWLVSGKTIRNVKVEVGDADNLNTEILSGLAKNDSIVLDTKSLTDQTGISGGATQRSPFLPNFHRGNQQGAAKK